MATIRRPVSTATLAAGAALAIVSVLGGCVGGASPTPAPASASGASPALSSPSQTTIEWGTIWDALPAAFPAYPGAEPVDSAAGPASATLTVPADARAATEWWRAALEQGGYGTAEVSGPFEDGSRVIDLKGNGDCRVQVTVAPTGATTTATILFGAGCPYR
jgi:hypothetical protein